MATKSRWPEVARHPGCWVAFQTHGSVPSPKQAGLAKVGTQVGDDCTVSTLHLKRAHCNPLWSSETRVTRSGNPRCHLRLQEWPGQVVRPALAAAGRRPKTL